MVNMIVSDSCYVLIQSQLGPIWERCVIYATEKHNSRLISTVQK